MSQKFEKLKTLLKELKSNPDLFILPAADMAGPRPGARPGRLRSGRHALSTPVTRLAARLLGRPARGARASAARWLLVRAASVPRQTSRAAPTAPLRMRCST